MPKANIVSPGDARSRPPLPLVSSSVDHGFSCSLVRGTGRSLSVVGFMMNPI